MTEYLEKHKLKTKEDIAQHIVELKRNTFPDLELISSLCCYLFDGEKTNRLHCIPIDATNIEVFHLDTKDNGDRTAFIGFKISNGNFSFVEVPFTSQNPVEKTEKQGVLNDHVKEVIEKGASTRHKSQNGETHIEPIKADFFNTGNKEQTFDVRYYRNITEAKNYFEKSTFTDACYYDNKGKLIVEQTKREDGFNKRFNDENHVIEEFNNLLTKTYIGGKIDNKVGWKFSSTTEPIFKDNPNLGENTSITPDQVREGIQKGIELLQNIKDNYRKRIEAESLAKVGITVRESSSALNEEQNKKYFDHLNGKKENKNKTDYSEIDWDIIDLMGKRFNDNKHKYPKDNMLKPIDKKELLFASFRHLRKMIQPIENDEETFQEHLTAVLCNMQMVYQQDKLNKS